MTVPKMESKLKFTENKILTFTQTMEKQLRNQRKRGPRDAEDVAQLADKRP